MSNINILRKTAEELYQKELDALIAAETDPIPTGWRMSPRSVLTYIMGNTKVGGVEITPKYMGNRRLVEIAIATLVTDRALLLIGEPGTAKSWLSEHLAAAINGDSTKVVQGTAGTTEEQIRYSWNYAMLIAKGPSQEAMVKSPVYRAMENGTIARIEEISRCASEVQDALISILSEKRMSVPELSFEVPAQKGFSVIATANTRDKGVNDMSAALKRRFNIVVLPTPADMATEIDIVYPCGTDVLWVGSECKAAGYGYRGKDRYHLPGAAQRRYFGRQAEAENNQRCPFHSRSDFAFG